MEREPGSYYLGHQLEDGERTDPLHYDSSDLTTHGVIVGMTGSGKTGLGVIALEEALLAGTPILAFDLKGDLTNLSLVFPDLAPADFRPWIEPGAAKREGLSEDALADQVAERWRGGLAGSGLGQADLAALRDAADVTVYTPGSTAGVPLNVIGELSAPADGNAEDMREEASAIASGLLGLVDVDADPLSSPAHILIANLVEQAWAKGEDLDLPTLLARIMEPPFRKLGVFELDVFFPADERRALAMRLNALLASPTFAAWTEGQPLDIETLLRGSDGRPGAAVIYIAHLSDAERQFVVALVLSKLVTWMRQQSGSGDLRALVYLDEVFGFVPPTAEPPTKRVLLTLLKQGRAFGVGLLLATQNPVDLDYKAMSNAGTWMIGRLQTERDKARILEGLRSAAGGFDLGAMSDLVTGLGSREFVLHNTHDRGGPKLFTTRWAMSYLRGPLTRDQVSLLTGPPRATVPEEQAADPASVVIGASAKTPVSTPEELAEDETRLAPEVPDQVPVRYADPAAPWLHDIGGDSNGRRYAPAVVARVHLLFDERRAGLDHQEQWEAVLFPIGDAPSAADWRPIDFDERDLRPAAPSEDIVFRLDSAPLATAAFYRDLKKDLVAELKRNRSLELLRNPKLKLFSRPGESSDEFAVRCNTAAEKGADEDAAKLRKTYNKKMDRVRAALERAEDRVTELQHDTKSRRGHEFVAAASDLLGSFFGGRKSTRSIATGAGRVLKGASSRRSVSSRASQRLRTAENRLEDQGEKLEDLEQELLDEILEIDERWQAAAAEVEPFPVSLEANDIDVDDLVLAWLPTD